MEAIALQFRAKTVSPFHSTRQEYANLIKCAPFIMGSTIRGAIVGHLIRMFCSSARLQKLQEMKDPQKIASFHRDCTEACHVKLFFAEKPIIWFSFGEFEEIGYQTMTRIGTARNTRSAAEGSIFNIETIAPGSNFTFRIILFESGIGLQPLVIDAVKQVGELQGVGRCRSIGFGRFEITDRQLDTFDVLIERELGRIPKIKDRLNMSFRTPFVLEETADPISIREERLGQYVMDRVHHVASFATDNQAMEPMRVESIEAQLHPEFISRFSYERGLRENRLVAWPGSSLVLSVGTEKNFEQLALAALLGIGTWNYWGFGQFELI